jgi:hypothetical protein
MPWVRFETTISAFERAKTVHALAPGIGIYQGIEIVNVELNSWRQGKNEILNIVKSIV